MVSPEGITKVLFLKYRSGICGFFFLWFLTSCSQVIIKNSSNDNIFHSNWVKNDGILMKISSFYSKKVVIWWRLESKWTRAKEKRNQKTQAIIDRLRYCSSLSFIIVSKSDGFRLSLHVLIKPVKSPLHKQSRFGKFM